MEIIFVILILIVLITLLGHANWLFLSFLMRNLSGKPQETLDHDTQAAITKLGRLLQKKKISSAEYSRLVSLIQNEKNEPQGYRLPIKQTEQKDIPPVVAPVFQDSPVEAEAVDAEAMGAEFNASDTKADST